jgi:protein required for attachment to host cells
MSPHPIRMPSQTLVVVSDGRKALYLRNHGSAQMPDLVVEAAREQDNPSTRDQGTDKPGRRAGADGVRRSANDETDHHDLGETRFSASVAESLYPDPPTGPFEHLVLVAPPTALAVLRRHLHSTVAQRVLGEIPKTLTQHSVADIQKVLAAA